MSEVWHPTRERADYFVSNLGNARGPRKQLTPQRQSNGYWSVQIGKGKTRHLHVLVAEAFIPNPDQLPQVNHIDGNKKNNTVSNLEWTSARDNKYHAMRLGLQKGKFTADQIREIRTRLTAGERNVDLASEFNTDVSSIAKIRLRKVYAWVD